MSDNLLPERPITQEECDAAFKRACVKSEQRGNKLVSHKIEPRMCLVCMSVQWFLVTIEENQILHRYAYKFCIGGKHYTMRERQ